MELDTQDSVALGYKSGQVSSHLNTTTATIRRWVNRYPEFFSELSQVENKYHMRYTPEDVLVMATIQHLSNKNMGLDEIEEQLRLGVRFGHERVEELLANSPLSSNASHRGLNPTLIGLELRQTRMERDQTAADKRLLEEKNEALLREIAELKYRLGMVEGKLELLEQQRAR